MPPLMGNAIAAVFLAHVRGGPAPLIARECGTPHSQAEAASSVKKYPGQHTLTGADNYMERVTRLELATSTMARWRSTR